MKLSTWKEKVVQRPELLLEKCWPNKWSFALTAYLGVKQALSSTCGLLLLFLFVCFFKIAMCKYTVK